MTSNRFSAARGSEPAPSECDYAIGVALLATAALVLWWPWLSGAVTIPWDAKAQFYPELAFLARVLAGGQSPFWSPNVFAGWPQIADPQSLIFSPAHLLLALVTPRPGFIAADAVVFAALFVGGLAVILIFRDRGWHGAGALAAALAFAFGGSAAARIQHTGQVLSLALFPLALWLLDRALRGRPWAALGAGLVAGVIAVGRDQVALLALFVLSGAVVAHWLEGPGRFARVRTSMRPLIVGAAAGAAVIAVPLALSALLAADSNRPAMDFVSAGRGSLHPAHLLTLAFADLYGANDPAIPYWGPPSVPWGPTDLFLAQNMGQLYLGALPLVALVAARGVVRAGEVRFLLVAAALILLYGLGWYTPAFRAMFTLMPGVDLFRRPADASFLFCGLLAILGGYGVHRIATDGTAAWRRAGLVALVLAGGAIALARARGMGPQAAIPVATGLAFSAAAIGLVLALPRRGAAAVVLVGAFVTADLAWNNGPNESTALPPAKYEMLRHDTANETVALLKSRIVATPGGDRRDRVELAGIGYPWPNLSLVHGFDHLFGHNPLRLADFARATGVGDTIAVPDQRGFAPLFASYRSPMADLFGLRFIATGVPIETIDPSLPPGALPLIARTADAYVYENPNALPRVLVVGEAQKADFPALLADGRWPAFDPRRTVLLEADPGARPPGPPGEARIVRYGTTEVEVEVEAPAGGFLVLNDVWHPWWRARVDGAPVRVLRANVLFRAVAVPAGRSRVAFSFHPLQGALDQWLARAGLR